MVQSQSKQTTHFFGGSRAGEPPRGALASMPAVRELPDRAFRVRSHCRFASSFSQVISDLLRDSVALFLKRQYDRAQTAP
jgi:hypothetical protein